MKKEKVKTEFSKKIFYIITSLTVFVILYSMALMWYTRDASALAYLIPSIFVEMGTCTGFYFWKARKENELKIMKEYGKDVVDQIDEMEE